MQSRGVAPTALSAPITSLTLVVAGMKTELDVSSRALSSTFLTTIDVP